MSAGAFGPSRASPTRLVSGVERRADEPASADEWPGDLRDELSDETAWLLSSFQFFMAAAVPDMHVSIAGARMMVMNHATNDVMALLGEVVHLDGRPAARTARAMFEHLVNYADMKTSVDMENRYTEHQYVTHDLIGRRTLYYRSQGRRKVPSRSRQQTRLLRGANGPLKQALSRYGTAFQRGFTPQSLKDRAKGQGFESGYDGYRILSGVMHGTAGGLLGTRRQVKGLPVHRTGPDLELASIAYIEGITWWRDLLELMIVDSGATSRLGLLIERSEALIRAWPEVSDALEKIDRKLWPARPPAQVHAILAIYASGERWYVYRPHEGTVTPAQRAQSGEAESVVAHARELYAAYDPTRYGGRPMTVAVPHIRVSEVPGANSASASSIIVPEDILPLYGMAYVEPPRRGRQ